MKIHPTAIVEPGAEIGEEAEIGPYCVVGKEVRIGACTRLRSHVVVQGWTEIGEGNDIYSGAAIGTEPQDLKFGGEESRVKIGKRNVVREFVTVNRGTDGGGGETLIGDDNLLMAYAHVAHDCSLGNHVIMSNAATLGGHVTIEDGAIMSGLVGVHHFVTVGRMALVGGASKVVTDVPPYGLVDGHPARVHGVNIIGLERKKVSKETIACLKQAYRIIFHSGLNQAHALAKVKEEVRLTPEIEYLVEFIERSRRGKKGRAREAERAD